MLNQLPRSARCVVCAQKAMKDKVANVFLAALTFFPALMEAFGHRDAQSACDAVLPILIEKLGDSNTRLRWAAPRAPGSQRIHDVTTLCLI
jgi:hypothetical protein